MVTTVYYPREGYITLLPMVPGKDILPPLPFTTVLPSGRNLGAPFTLFTLYHCIPSGRILMHNASRNKLEE